MASCFTWTMFPSTFVQHHTQGLIRSPSSILISSTALEPSAETQTLRSLLISLKTPLTSSAVRDAVNLLVLSEQSAGVDPDQSVLKKVVIDKLVVSLYAEALDTYLAEASNVEAEAEWWADIERSRQNVAWYLLQTLPARLFNLGQAIIQTLRTRRFPIRLSRFTPAALRHYFPSTSTLRHNTLTISLFPHLQFHPHIISLLYDPTIYSPSQNVIYTAINTTTSFISRWIRMFSTFFMVPFDLARQECEYKRKELEKLRDQRAEVLGTLAVMRGSLRKALEESNRGNLAWFVDSLERLTQDESASSPLSTPPSTDTEIDVVALIQRFANITLQSHRTRHVVFIQNLRRPSRMTLLWPRLLLLPPMALYLLRLLYASRTSLFEIAKDAGQTVDRFSRGWLLEPLKDVLRTVRAGGEDGIIIKKEGIAADLDSLERMTLALAHDKLQYGPEQLTALAQQIRLGDLTPVLRIYEEDIKSPLKSAVTGTLLRSIFVQVQKAKVDLDQTLAGVDKLLKSQELTFAFVGVAPALAIVYVAGGLLQSLWAGGRGRGRYGGKHRRARVWFTMRRIERLLISQPKSSYNSHPPRLMSTSDGIPSLTSGLLLLSLTHLRAYAESSLPAYSLLREGFLDDVANLEDPSLGRAEKMRIVDRMWKSWGQVLGWGGIAGEMSGR